MCVHIDVSIEPDVTVKNAQNAILSHLTQELLKQCRSCVADCDDDECRKSAALFESPSQVVPLLTASPASTR